MKLYYAETLMPRKVCAVARYLGSPVEYVPVALDKGEQMTPAFTALNPNKKVPVLEVAAGKSLWESNAIMCFLAREAGSELWPEDERQVEVLRWLCWDLQHFTRYGGMLYFQNVIKPMFIQAAPDPKAVEEATGFFKTSARVLDNHLRGRKYLIGDTLTLADFATAVALPYAERAQIPLAEFPEVARWHSRLNELPAWREPFPAAKAAA